MFARYALQPESARAGVRSAHVARVLSGGVVGAWRKAVGR